MILLRTLNNQFIIFEKDFLISFNGKIILDRLNTIFNCEDISRMTISKLTFLSLNKDITFKEIEFKDFDDLLKLIPEEFI